MSIVDARGTVLIAVTYAFYNTLHIVGIMLVFMSLGATVLHASNGGTRDTNPSRKLVAALHGVGLLVIIVAGFGMLAKNGGMNNGLPGYIHPKLLIWLLLGAAPVLIGRKPGLAKAMWLLIPLLGAVAAFFGINHS